MGLCHASWDVLLCAVPHLLDTRAKGRPMNLKLEVRNGKHPENHSLVDFYCQTYMRQDPVVLAAGVSDLSEMREFLSKSLETQRSVLLTDGERGAVVAAISGGPVTYSNVADMRFYADKTMKDDRSSRLVNLWASITSESGLLDHLHLPVLWDVSFLATEPRVQRHGLATFLLLQQRRLASSLGYSALCLECTNPLLAELARRTGFHGVSCRALDSYLDPHGQPWVSAPTHLQVEVFYRVLHDKVNSVHQF